jgi:FMN-dependent NADH-azoreductase
VPNLLHLDSSADLVESVSRDLTARFAASWTTLGPDHVVTRRDLHTDPLPHLPTNLLHWAPRLRDEGAVVPAEAEALQQTLVAEVSAADVLVIGAPMYNWSVPSTLKAWIDYIQIGGTTSSFDTQTQPFAGKPVVVVSSRGNGYGPGAPGGDTDFETLMLRQVLGVALAMDVTVVTAELTLASRAPALAPLAAQARTSLESARQAMIDLPTRLGRK